MQVLETSKDVDLSSKYLETKKPNELYLAIIFVLVHIALVPCRSTNSYRLYVSKAKQLLKVGHFPVCFCKDQSR